MTSASPVPRRTVLVVEDELGVQRIVRRTLEREGYHVLTASDAAEATEIFHREGAVLDLIIADVKMPGQSGPEMIEALSATADLPAVLYVSGYADTRELESVGAQGAPLLSKPFLPDALVAKVRELIEG